MITPFKIQCESACVRLPGESIRNYMLVNVAATIFTVHRLYLLILDKYYKPKRPLLSETKSVIYYIY